MTETASNVVLFPTSRKRPYRNPPGWWLSPTPENVQAIRPSRPAAVLEPLPATGYAILGPIEALRTDPAAWERSGGPDVLRALFDMGERWTDDAEARAGVRAAIDLICSRRSGRWSPSR